MPQLECLEHAATSTLGGRAGRVAPTEVACREHHTSHEVDVVAVEVEAQRPDRIIANGEAKWRAVACDVDEVLRLEHLRDLLGAPGARLLVFSRLGFRACERWRGAAATSSSSTWPASTTASRPPDAGARQRRNSSR
ncbi:MAG: hypothetical protein ACYDEN_12950 [Acidimicrobiales bacterium]